MGEGFIDSSGENACTVIAKKVEVAGVATRLISNGTKAYIQDLSLPEYVTFLVKPILVERSDEKVLVSVNGSPHELYVGVILPRDLYQKLSNIIVKMNSQESGKAERIVQ